MIGIPQTRNARRFGRASPEHRDRTPIDCGWNIGRTLDDFQRSVRIINRLLRPRL
jgi:hypothetical protein